MVVSPQRLGVTESLGADKTKYSKTASPGVGAPGEASTEHLPLTGSTIVSTSMPNPADQPAATTPTSPERPTNVCPPWCTSHPVTQFEDGHGLHAHTFVLEPLPELTQGDRVVRPVRDESAPFEVSVTRWDEEPDDVDPTFVTLTITDDGSGLPQVALTWAEALRLRGALEEAVCMGWLTYPPAAGEGVQ